MGSWFLDKNHFPWGSSTSQQEDGFQLPLFVVALGGHFDHEPEVQAAARSCWLSQNQHREVSRWL